MTTWHRRQRIVDREVQSAVLARVILYWMAWLLVAALVAAILHATGLVSAGESLASVWRSLVPMLLAGIVLLPIALVDAATLSNRLVGSLVRLRRELRQLAGGEAVRPLRFRHGDFWQDCADELNALRERVSELEAERNQTPSAVGNS